MTATGRASYVVLQEVAPDTWKVIGEVGRRPGLPARASRARAIEDVTRGEREPDASYRVLPRSEWRLAADS